MRKKWRGYFTIEAAFILPIVLFLYLLIILTALFLYCRCVISQDNFLIGMRAERFTDAEENYGEAIYGQKEKGSWNVKDYIKNRIERKYQYYPFFPPQEGGYNIYEKNIIIKSRQKGSKKTIEKIIWKTNPVAFIREGRRK